VTEAGQAVAGVQQEALPGPVWWQTWPGPQAPQETVPPQPSGTRPQAMAGLQAVAAVWGVQQVPSWQTWSAKRSHVETQVLWRQVRHWRASQAPQSSRAPEQGSSKTPHCSPIWAHVRQPHCPFVHHRPGQQSELSLQATPLPPQHTSRQM